MKNYFKQASCLCMMFIPLQNKWKPAAACKAANKSLESGWFGVCNGVNGLKHVQTLSFNIFQ